MFNDKQHKKNGGSGANSDTAVPPVSPVNEKGKKGKKGKKSKKSKKAKEKVKSCLPRRKWSIHTTVRIAYWKLSVGLVARCALSELQRLSCPRPLCPTTLNAW